MHNGLKARRGRLAAAGVILVAINLAASAQKRDSTSAGVPVATNTIRQNADAYYGKVVTISAGVDEVISKTIFVVDQRRAVGAKEVKAIGKPVLVIAPSLIGTIEPNTYVVVRGEIVKFDEASITNAAADYQLDLAPEIAQRYRGQPVLVANSVIDAMYVELAKPPPTPAGAAQ